MLKHHTIMALRSIASGRLQSVIAIGGLAIGITAAILMALVIRNQLSFDHFIPGYERTYVGVSELSFPGYPVNYNLRTHRNAAALLKLNRPEVENATRLMLADIGPLGGGVLLRQGEVSGHEVIYWAEPNLATVLPLPVYRGDLATALAQPDGIVLPRAMARKYFGSEEVVGRAILLDGHPMTVRAVIQDLPPAGTELQSGIFASSLAAFSAFAGDAQDRPGNFTISMHTYLRLKPGASIAGVEGWIPELVKRLSAGPGIFGDQPLPYLMSLHRIDQLNLFEGLYPGIRSRLAVEGVVGLLILLISAINFVNLVTARAGRRAREVGMRKACGASRSMVALQFLGEAVLVVFFATCIALGLSEWLLPDLNAFLQTGASSEYWRSPAMMGALVLGVGLLGAIAGAWPALVLSAFRPARTLKGGGTPAEGAVTRNLLTGLQFAVLVVLMVATIVVFQQRTYATSEGLRVNVDQMLMVRRSCEPAFRAEVRKLPGVAGVSCTGGSFLNNSQSTTIPWKGADLAVDSIRVDPGIFALYGIKPLAGSLPADSAQGDYDESWAHALIFNEAAIRKLGFASPQAAIGQIIPQRGPGNGPPMRIAAVVPDFAFTSVEKELQATKYDPGPPERTAGDLVSIRLKGEAIPETLAAIDRLWAQTTGNRHPISRFFLADHMQEQYLSMVRQGQMLAVFAGLAILIACMGLFGLSLSTTERRIKEIGVRKVMGAENRQIVTLLLWQFGRPVLWANLLAWPVAWWLMQRWLSGFAYHVELEWWVFAAASLGALAVAMVTVAGQAWLTARQKPVLALRYE